jgi:tRNA (cmo5U34)-methyltransferase
MSDFDSRAAEWDKNQVTLDRATAVASALRKKIPSNGDLKALEFGAGTGLLSFHLKELFTEIVLMDTSREMLKIAEQKIEGEDRKKFRTLFFDLQKEEPGGEPFDVVCNQMVLHHIRDTRAILEKFFRLLKPGGMLAIADLYTEDGSFHDGNPDVHFGFDPGELASLLSIIGFTGIRHETCFVMKKEIAQGKVGEFPIFLLTATRPAGIQK